MITILQTVAPPLREQPGDDARRSSDLRRTIGRSLGVRPSVMLLVAGETFACVPSEARDGILIVKRIPDFGVNASVAWDCNIACGAGPGIVAVPPEQAAPRHSQSRGKSAIVHASSVRQKKAPAVAERPFSRDFNKLRNELARDHHVARIDQVLVEAEAVGRTPSANATSCGRWNVGRSVRPQRAAESAW